MAMQQAVQRRSLNLKKLIGSGDRIGLVTLPFLVAGVALNVAFPSLFIAGGPPAALRVIAWTALVAGVAMWAWSVVLILAKVPHGELITTGPYAVAKHPLYTAVALLVLPAIGLLLNTWVGEAIGIVMYLAARRFASAEEEALAATFGSAWESYLSTVKLPWL